MEILKGKQALLLGCMLALASGCEDAPCTPEQCDIRQPSCQRAVMDATACLSGVDAVDVEVEVIAAGDYRRMREEAAAEDADVALETVQRALALLALGPAGDTPVQVAGDLAGDTAASYSPAENRVYIIDRGMPLDSKNSVALLVHEFTHALQFETEGRLPAETVPTTDAQLALAATIEGEATWNGDRALKLLIDGTTADVNFRRIYGAWVRDTWRRYYDEERKVARARSYFAYPFGAWFILEAGRGRTDLPVARSTAEVMYGLAAGTGSTGSTPVLEGETLRVDSMGSFIVEGWLLSRMRDFDVPESLYPPYVVADTLTLLRDAEGHLGAVWRIAFEDSVTDLAEAFAELEADNSRLGDIGHVATTTRGQRTMLVFASEDEGTARAWADNPPDFQPLDFTVPEPNTGMAARFLSCPHSRKD